MTCNIITQQQQFFPRNSGNTNNNNSLRAYNTLNTNQSCLRASITRRTTLEPSPVRRSLKSNSSSMRKRGHLCRSRFITCLRSRGDRLSSLTRSIIKSCSKSKRRRLSRLGMLMRSVVERQMGPLQMTKKTYSPVSTTLTSRRVVARTEKPRLILVLSSCPEVAKMTFRLSAS